MSADHDHGHFLCPTCQQHIPHAKIDVVDVAKAIAASGTDEGQKRSRETWASQRRCFCPGAAVAAVLHSPL